MVRKIEVTIPLSMRSQIEPLLRGHASVQHLVVIPCENAFIFQFVVVNKKADDIIEKLTQYGVATTSKLGTVDVHALRTCKPRVTTRRDTSKKYRKAYSYYDRLPFDEIEETVDGQLHLTFDYLAMIVIGALIAGVGLLTDSSVSVVASMLVSPLMGPILGMTFGFVIDKKKMYRKALRNELIGVLVCFLTGCVLGLLSAPFIDPIDSETLGYGINTQMSSRGDPANLIWGALIAIPSGMGVALGVATDQVSALIGVAISASLLPPICNCGISIMIAMVLAMQKENDSDIDDADVNHYLEIGGVSMILFIMNWCLIFVCGVATFRLKKVGQTYRRLGKLTKFNEMASTNDEIEMVGAGNDESEANVAMHMKGSMATISSPSADAAGAPKKSMDSIADEMESSGNVLDRSTSYREDGLSSKHKASLKEMNDGEDTRLRVGSVATVKKA